MVYRFNIPGEPKGKVNMKPIKMGNHLSLCNPQHNVNYMSLVRDAWFSGGFDRIPDEACIRMTINATFSIPTSISKRRKQMMALNVIRPTKKPDCDNISKVICDALNGVAFHDDSMIVTLNVTKSYGDFPQVAVQLDWYYNDGRQI